MAKLISIVGSLSGKLAGTVYSHNRWGSYIRQLTMPTQPRTVYQQNQRGRISACAELWSTLTASQRLLWQTYSTQIMRMDRLGQPLSYNGFTAFVLVNTELLFLGQAAMTDPPILWSGYQPDQILFNVTAGVMTLTNIMQGGTSLVTTGNQHVILWSNPFQSQGTTYPATWRAFATRGKNTVLPIVLTADYAARFGAIPAATGLRFFLGVTLVNQVTTPPGSQAFYVSQKVDQTVLSLLA